MKQQQTRVIIAMVDSYASMALEGMRNKNLNEFPGLKVSKTTFYNRIHQKYALNFKKLENS
jgi:hypothetical protein